MSNTLFPMLIYYTEEEEFVLINSVEEFPIMRSFRIVAKNVPNNILGLVETIFKMGGGEI